MAKQLKISSFNQPIEVQELTLVDQPDGTQAKDYVTRFSTKYANIKAIGSNQGYSEGISEKDTYYMIRFTYQQDRVIDISDQILWAGKILRPVGDCVITDFGDKRVYEQKVKYISD